MGLSLKAVNFDYHFDEELEEYVGYKGYSTDCGYFGFARFRNDLVKFITNNKLNFDSNYCGKPLTWCWFDSETYEVRMDRSTSDFEDEDYFNKLETMKNQFPKLYDLYPFIAHCDCEGSIPYTQLEKALPILKEFQSQANETYGYSGRDYDWLEEVIGIIQEVINIKGKLWFS